VIFRYLVLHDILGSSFGKLARFVRPYANLHEVMTKPSRAMMMMCERNLPFRG